MNEVHALSQLSYPSIIEVLDYGHEQRNPFCVMEFIVGGQILRQKLGKTYSWQDASRLLLPVANALVYVPKKTNL
jgi:hypothetical protein